MQLYSARIPNSDNALDSQYSNRLYSLAHAAYFLASSRNSMLRLLKCIL